MKSDNPGQNRNITRVLLILALILLNAGIDQITKALAREHLPGKGTISVVGSVFVLHYAENQGAFLGMGSGLPDPWRRIVLAYLPAAILLGLMIYILFRKARTTGTAVSAACVLGGGIGNIIDRILHSGRVTDFMNFGIGSLRTGILNTADLSITFGAAAFLILAFRESGSS